MGGSASVATQSVSNKAILGSYSGCGSAGSTEISVTKGVKFLPVQPMCGPTAKFEVGNYANTSGECLLNNLQANANSLISGLDANTQAELGISLSDSNTSLSDQITEITSSSCPPVSSAAVAVVTDTLVRACDYTAVTDLTTAQSCQINNTQDLITKAGAYTGDNTTGGSVFGDIFGSGFSAVLYVLLAAVILIIVAVVIVFIIKSGKGKKGEGEGEGDGEPGDTEPSEEVTLPDAPPKQVGGLARIMASKNQAEFTTNIKRNKSLLILIGIIIIIIVIMFLKCYYDRRKKIQIEFMRGGNPAQVRLLGFNRPGAQSSALTRVQGITRGGIQSPASARIQALTRNVQSPAYAQLQAFTPLSQSPELQAQELQDAQQALQDAQQLSASQYRRRSLNEFAAPQQPRTYVRSYLGPIPESHVSSKYAKLLNTQNYPFECNEQY